jgi:hypothetical protein
VILDEGGKPFPMQFIASSGCNPWAIRQNRSEKKPGCSALTGKTGGHKICDKTVGRRFALRLAFWTR